VITICDYCLQCFDAVGWAACKKLSGGVLASGVVIFLEQDTNLQTYGAGDATVTHYLMLQ